MPYVNDVPYFGAYGGGDNTASQARNPTTSRQLSESTQKLFDAINGENLEAFKQALAEGADVNAFDKGYTPLMTIIMNGDDSPICLKMMMLLLQHKSLNINAQETKECNTALHLAFLMENRNFVRMLLRHPNLDIDVKNNYAFIKPEYQQLPEEHLRDFYKKRCSHTPKEYIEQIGENQKKDFSYLTMEITKAQKVNELLGALASRDFYQANMLLNEELNPNCWKRTQDGRIKTPLSLIIRLCLRTITEDKKEVLIKLLKHKDLDFSYEQYAQLKQTMEQAITERLTGTINEKDLDDVKKLVEDNCFMNHAVVTAALRNVNNPIESITNYLNEKFPASAEQPVANTHNVQPEINDEFIARELQQLENLRNELERTKAQLTETEQELANKTSKISQLEKDLRQEKSAQKTKINDLNSEVTRLNRIVYGRASDTIEISQLKRDLKQVREERDMLSSENRLLRTKSLSNKNEKPSQAISSGREQSNYAYASFVLSGAFAVGACLTIPNLEICIPLAVTAFAFFTIGCYFSYKANTTLSNVKSTQLGNVISLE
ncbi:hypothetical protein HCR16_04155 [Wolbachia pipientis]|uniref:TomO hydrophobic C-terminal domain-containing protein n=1 Tax=Wolbachia pipientis TaxID=955 RepID=UPI0015F7C256|nr:ankyrin repeat domain-containing protein [Wolbachia pipientis]MBA8770293.1 hypothetical protein [Wolbachia pipientis]